MGTVRTKHRDGGTSRVYVPQPGRHAAARLIVAVPSSFIDTGSRNAETDLRLDKLENESEPDPIGQRVASNLQRLRSKRLLSLDGLARASGVSRAMLAQIETGRSVPSIKVLCKIAKGLKVSVAAFLEHREFEGVAVLPARESKRLVSADGAFVSRALFPYDVARQTEFYELRLSPLSEEVSAGHGPGVQENIVVAQGALEIIVNEERFLLSTGDSILFYADQPHRYRNPVDSEAVAYLVVTHPERRD